MKTFKLYSLFLLSILFVFSSCSKDDDPKPQTKTELLTAKAWKITKIKENGIDITNRSDMAILKNVRIKYNTDGTYTQTSSGIVHIGIWEFNNNETLLVYAPNTKVEENWDIIELKSGSLKVRTTMIYEDEYGVKKTMLVELEMNHA
ncbi:DUF5004 domain-containing protein [Pontibacter pudoricolor]|uniref:DUF5004 domain-containing protein n=1 Tax=Pontibacter pudoricolor TaxID=2694930 RepID=UPI00139175D6|nr:DUF5004 domain-containing protein [Pontibacter pudoricolor]